MTGREFDPSAARKLTRRRLQLQTTLLGLGHFLPQGGEQAEETEQRLGLPAGWIRERTGIQRRPLAGPEEATSDLAVKAGEAALADAGVDPGEVELLLLATSTPDHLLPPTAPVVAHRLGLRGAGALDLAGACSGFLYGLALADGYLRVREGPALVVAANVLSRRIDPGDAKTSALFADGAGATVVGRTGRSRKLVAWWVGSDGSCWDDLFIPSGGSRRPLTAERVGNGEHWMYLRDGKALFRRAVLGMVGAGRNVLAQAGVSVAEVSWWVPHQANSRVVEEARRRLGVPAEKTIQVVDRIGNSSAATIPLALGLVSDRFKTGDLVLLTSVGVGLLTAAAVIRW